MASARIGIVLAAGALAASVLVPSPASPRPAPLGADGVVAEVELGTLSVSYHSLESTSPLPTADVCENRSRTARWLGRGLIALSGFDSRQFTGADGRRYARFEPAGGPVGVTLERIVRGRSAHQFASI